MAKRNRNDDDRLSTDDAARPEIGTRIGGVPGEDDPVNISGFPGGGAGWGAWPEGMGTQDDAPDQPAAETRDEEEDASAGGNRIGTRQGQIADSGVTTGPVGT